jgi:CRP-like cAMP-binding protein
MEHEEIISALGECEFFKGLDRGDIERLVDLCGLKIYESGEYLFRQGDMGEHIYIVADGQVFLERSIDLGGRKGNVVIETLTQGRVLGCWSSLLNEPHRLMSSAICQKQSKVLVMKGKALRALMLENRAFGFNVMERFCFLLRDRIQAAYGALEKI